MPTTFRTFFIVPIFTILLFNQATSQTKSSEFINASIGFGFTAPYDNVDISSSGFYVQGEYVLGINKWFGVRPYAGLVITSADKNNIQQNKIDYKVTSKAFLLGGKVRVLAPIPWVSPYFEIGIGASIGSFETFIPNTNIKKNGVLMHIPFSIGLAIGKKHNLDVAFTYYYHQSVQQFSGATAIGFSFPIK